MSNESTFVGESLEALLVSIAEGVREAQNALSSTPPVDSFGRPMPTYHLPHLDFEVRVDMETQTASGGRPFLRISPLVGKDTASREISSLLSGRLVAVPPGDGLPVPILSITSLAETNRRHRIDISAINSAGEILAGHQIELNINVEASIQLSVAAGVNLTTLRAGTRLDAVLLTTDTDGTAQTLLRLDSRLAAGALVVLTAELGGESVNLTVSAGGGA